MEDLPVWRAGDPNLPRHLLEQCATSETPSVRRDAAGNPSLPERLQEKLLGDPDRNVRRSVLTNPSLVYRLQRATVQGVSFVAWNPGSLLRRDLPRLEASRSRAFLAQNTSLAEDLQEELVGDSSLDVLTHLGGNLSLTESAQLKLAWAGRPEVYPLLAANPGFRPNASMPVAFLRNHAAPWLESQVGDVDLEAFEGLGENWEGSLADLLEALNLVQ